MEESYSEGLASHTGPESCASPLRKDGREALTGGSAGRVLSREITLSPGCRRRHPVGRQHPERRQRKPPRDPARSETPCTHGNTSRENREVLCSPTANGAGGRVGKPEGMSRR